MNRLLFIGLIGAVSASVGWAQVPTKPGKFYSKDEEFVYQQRNGHPSESVPPAEAAERMVLFYRANDTNHRNPGKLRYFPSENMSLVIGELDEYRIVKNAFIEVLDLQELATWLREHYFPNKPLFPVHFYNCLIGRVVNSNATPDLQVAFDTELIFEETSIQAGRFSVNCPRIQFINTDLHDTRFFNCRFGQFEFVRSYIAQNQDRKAFNNYDLYDPVAYGRYKVHFQDCVFQRRAYLTSSALEHLCFNNCEFQDSVFFRPNPHYMAKLVQKHNEQFQARPEPGHDYVSSTQLPVKQNPYVLQADFHSTTFAGAVSVAGMRLDSCRFDNASFNHSLDLTNVQASTVQYFNHCHFRKKMPFAIDVTNRSIELLQLNLQELPRLTFNLAGIDTTAMTERNLTQTNEFFNALEGYVASLKEVPEEEKKEALDHVAYERERYQTRFYWENRAKDGNGWNWTWHRLILGSLVNNGYHGYWKLLAWSAGIIVFFSFLFALPWNRERVVKIVHENGKPAERRAAALARKRQPFPWASDWLMCLFFSFKLFIQPTFSPTYLNQRKGLVALILVEYVVSLGMLTLFLVYVAPELPFIKTLLRL